MAAVSPIDLIRQRLDLYFEKYVSRRIYTAIGLVLLVAMIAYAIAYLISGNAFVAFCTFGIVSIISAHFSFLHIVPPSSKIVQSKALIMGAIREPQKIKLQQGGKILIKQASGELLGLCQREQKVWDTIVMPFLKKNASFSTERSERDNKSVTTKSAGQQEDTVEFDQKQAELLKLEAKIKEEQRQLELERQELRERTEQLNQAENMVIDRLTAVEVAEAELQQLQEDVAQHEASVARAAAGGTSREELEKKEREFKEKEREIEQLKISLAEDRSIVQAQKTELNQMKGELLKGRPDLLSDEQLLGSSSSTLKEDTPSIEDRERLLEEKLREVERAAREVEERTKYVCNAENDLIDRLHQLTEREAFIEQNEINAGVRSDS